MRITYKVN